MNWRSKPLWTVGVLIGVGINAGLLADIALQMTSNDALIGDKTNWLATIPGTTPSAMKRKPIENYHEIVARPVFFKNREPYVPPPAPLPVAVMPATMPTVVDPGLVVAGVMIKQGLSRAYLLSKTGGDGSWTGEGEAFQGWTVKSIGQTGVKLEQGRRLLELQLYPQE